MYDDEQNGHRVQGTEGQKLLWVERHHTTLNQGQGHVGRPLKLLNEQRPVIQGTKIRAMVSNVTQRIGRPSEDILDEEAAGTFSGSEPLESCMGTHVWGETL